MNIQDADEESPLHLAIDARNPIGVKYLLEKGQSQISGADPGLLMEGTANPVEGTLDLYIFYSLKTL